MSIKRRTHPVAQWQNEVAVEIDRTYAHVYRYEFEIAVVCKGGQVQKPTQIRKYNAHFFQIVNLLEQLPGPHRCEVGFVSQEHEVRGGGTKLMPATRKITPNRRTLSPDAAMHQHRQTSPIIPLTCELTRPALNSVPHRTGQLVNAGKSLLSDLFEMIGNKDQMKVPAIIESSDELSHAAVLIRLKHLDVSHIPICSSQQEYFGKLRQVTCRLKQPQVPRRRSLLNHETPDCRPNSGWKHDCHPAIEPYQGPSFECRMINRLPYEQLRMLSLKHERLEVCRIDANSGQLIVTEADVATRLGHG